MSSLKKEKFANMRFLGRLLKPIIAKNRRLVAVFLALGIIASIMEGLGIGLVLPLLEGFKKQSNLNVSFPFNVFSAFFSGMSVAARVRAVAGILVLVTFLKGCALYFNNIYMSRLQIEFIKYYRIKCFNQLMNVGMEYINRQKGAHLQTTVISYTISLGALVSILGGLVPKLFTIIVLLTMLFLLSWKMTLISLFIVAGVTLVLRSIAQKAEKAGKMHTDSLKGINWTILDAIQGMKVIRLFRRESEATDRFESEVDKVNKSLFKLAKRRGSIQPLFESLGMAGLAVILVAGSFLLLSDARAQGLEVILTFILIFIRILTPAMAFNQARVAVRGDLPSYREVYKFLDPKDKPYISNGTKRIKRLSSSIEFQEVNFKYSSRESAALSNVSFEVKQGQKVGIVGSSGGGKSTIVELLLRFYDPQAGRIIIDGADLKELNLYSWRGCVGVVTQDTFLFHDTVRSNIAYADPEASQADIEAAARQAYAHDFIRQLPQGYDTIVGDRGVLLSGGQKQRIAIARAVLASPDILIFDEATSALDTESEEVVQKALHEVGKGKTVITIAHRLSTVYDSDNIIVLDEGRVVSQGKHSELLAQDGIYKKLVQMQAMNFSGKDYVRG